MSGKYKNSKKNDKVDDPDISCRVIVEMSLTLNFILDQTSFSITPNMNKDNKNTDVHITVRDFIFDLKLFF